MSTIRRHGVAFHLIPTSSDTLWLEVIRESDGAVLVSEHFRGADESDLAPAVEEWIGDIVIERVGDIEILSCRACGHRRREIEVGGDGLLPRDQLIEWEFDLCVECASHIEHSARWIRGWVEDRHPSYDDYDD